MGGNLQIDIQSLKYEKTHNFIEMAHVDYGITLELAPIRRTTFSNHT